ncbi:transporter substrate-binding domain-containing protein [Photobacterium swingsii]
MLPVLFLKRSVKVICMLLCCIVLSLSPALAAKSRLQEIIDRGVLRVGTTGDWHPMTMRDPATNFYKGFDIDITTELAKDLGVTVEYVPADWRTLVSGVVTDKYDITGSASLNMQRAKVAGYSKPYFYLAFVPVVHSNNLNQFRRWQDFNSSYVKVAATAGTVQAMIMKELFPDAQHQTVAAGSTPYNELLSKRATMTLTSNIEAASLASRYPKLKVAKVAGMQRPTPIAMLIPNDEQVWINYVNHWITLKQTQGFFDRIAKKWGIAHLDKR